MSEATLRGYFADLFSTVIGRAGELAVAAIGVVTGVAIIAMYSSGHLKSLIGVAIVAGVVLEGSLAGWRLYRRQSTVITTTRSLMQMDASDRAELTDFRRGRAHAR